MCNHESPHRPNGIAVKITARTQSIGVALYSLPFLSIIAFSFVFVWAGTMEMIVATIAVLPAVMYFLGLRWCRYVVGVISALGFLACSLVPITRGTDGRYFWLIWSPLWLLFAFSCFTSFIPAGRANENPRNTAH
jgi:hypothetical protein